MSTALPGFGAQVGVQTRYQLLVFMRSPVGMFFTLGLPTVMLILFNALFGDETITFEGGEWSVKQFYTGGLAAFTAVSATYTNLVNVVPIRRDEGILKRWRSTPVSSGAFLSGWILSAIVIAAIGVLIQLAIGVVLYDLSIYASRVPAMIVTFIVGVAVFAMLGLAVASFVPNADSAPAVANATILPLAFVSDVFIPMEDPPRWLEMLGNAFPLKHFVNAFQDTLNPTISGNGFAWDNLGYLLIWGVVGALLAAKFFRWEPATGRTRHRRGRGRGRTVT